jgi:hypothetical protein
MKKLTLFFVFIVASACIAGAATLKVPQQFGSIQAAISAAQNGDTVLVAPGTYYENINFRRKGIVVASLFLTTNDTAYIDQTVINGSQPLHADTASCVIITGANLAASTDSSAALIGFRITAGTGTKWDDEHNPGSKYREGGGILIQYSSPRILFNHICYNQAIYILGCVSGGGGAIRCGDGDPKIRNNVIDHNQGRYGAGLVFNFSGADIRNNIIAMNWGGEDFGGSGIWAYGVDGLSRPRNVVNNTIVYNSSALNGGGIRVWSTSMNLVNNILYFNSAPTGAQILNGGTTTVSYCDVQGGWAGTGNLALDPAFALENYYLTEASPCIDKGDSVTGYNDPPDPSNPGNALFPAKKLLRNDIGAYGGPGSALMAAIPSIMTGTGRLMAAIPSLIVYPNPATERVIVRMPDAGCRMFIEIFTADGRWVDQKEVGPGIDSIRLEVSALARGTYIVRATNGTTILGKATIVLQ